MNNLLRKLKKFIKRQRARFPSPVPVGMAEFDTWASDIIDTYSLPDNNSIKFALATMIMHSGPTDAFKSKHYFMLMVKASMSKQIASAQFQEIKLRQQKLAEQEAQENAKALEVAKQSESKQ